MKSALVKNGVLYCPYCNTELQNSSEIWFCDEDECFGQEESILWNDEGNLLEE